MSKRAVPVVEKDVRVPASTLWVSEKLKIKNNSKIKRDEEFKNFKNEGNTNDKTLKIQSNHISIFRTPGPSFCFSEGVEKTVGGEGTSCGTRAPPTSLGNLGIGSKERKEEKRGLEIERSREAPGKNS